MQGTVASHYHKMKQKQSFSDFISMFFVAQCLYENMNSRANWNFEPIAISGKESELN